MSADSLKAAFKARRAYVLEHKEYASPDRARERGPDAARSCSCSCSRSRRRPAARPCSTVTLKQLRQLLEEDLGLERDALKIQKAELSAMIDKVRARAGHAAPLEVSATPTPATSKLTNLSCSYSLLAQLMAKAAAKEAAPAPAKKAAPAPAKEPRASKKARRAESPAAAAPAPPPRAGPRQYGKRIEKLRAACRAATVTIPPTTYVKNKGSEEALAAALEALLAKHGLSAGSGERELARVKAQLALAKDLEGIDASNIVEGGRRRGAAASASYKHMLDEASDAESEEEGAGEASASGSESEEEAEAEASAEEGAAADKATSGEEEASSGDDEASEEGAAAPEAAAANPAANPATSPNENGADANGDEASPAKSPAKSKSASPAKQRKRLADWSDEDSG
jgi:hypothetical protein